MPTIALLSDALIDQIAAGEVVERPASVVKELGENALDAGARSIQVSIEGGGTRLIEVIDDGSGMSREDALLSVRRHATSKLRTADDLLAIRTLGFRGEALAAVASVARLVLRTALHGAPEGTEVRVEDGESQALPAAARPGTQVRVEDLFGAVPARRKFLRRAETELKHVEDAVLRLALAHPEVAFRLEHEGRTVRVLPASPDDLHERIAAALGPEVGPFLLPVEERRLGLRVHGVIASPEFSLSTARALYVFVNGRHVRDRTLHFAVHRGLAPVAPGRTAAGGGPLRRDRAHPRRRERPPPEARGALRRCRGGDRRRPGGDRPRGASGLALRRPAVLRLRRWTTRPRWSASCRVPRRRPFPCLRCRTALPPTARRFPTETPRPLPATSPRSARWERCAAGR